MAPKFMVSVVVGCCFITACQNKTENKETPSLSASQKANAEVTATQTTTSGTTDQSNKNSADLTTATDPTIDLSQAYDFNQDKDLSYLTALFLAKTTRQMSDEERLGLMSAEYANETDGFKKRDLSTKLLPQITTQIDKYKGNYIVKMPITDQNVSKPQFEAKQQQRHLSEISNFGFGKLIDSDHNASNGFYDFNTHSFHIDCGIGFEAQNQQKIKFDFGYYKDGYIPDPQFNPPPKEGCDLKIADETLAKKIEAQLVSQPGYEPNIVRNGEIYYTITADDNFLRAKPLYAKVTYSMPNTNETLISQEFHW